jgi:hypothetical protein
MTDGLVRGGIRLSFAWQFQAIPPPNVVQQCLVDLCLSHELLDPREIFMSPNTRSDPDDVFRPKNFCLYALVFERLRFAHYLFGQSGCGDESHREIFYEQMLTLNAPAFRFGDANKSEEFLRSMSCRSR